MDSSGRRRGSSPEAMINTALALYRQGRSATALKVLETIPEAKLGNDGTRLLALACAAENQVDRSISLIKAIEGNDRRPDDDKLLADCQLLKGQPEVARRTAETLLDRFPEFHPARRSLSRALEKLGKPRQAREELELYLKQAPDDAGAKADLGHLMLKADDIKGGIAVLEQVLERLPRDDRVLALLGDACVKQGTPAAADEYWARAVALAPENADYWCGAIKARRAAGKPEEAMDLAEQAVLRMPNDRDLLSLRCLTAIQTRHYDRAKTYLENMKDRGMMAAADWNNLGSAFEDTGCVDDAASYYRRAVELSPGYRDAHSNLVFCLNYSQQVSGVALRREHETWAAKFAPLRARPPHSNRPDPDKRLRVGYVTRDFNGHVISYFLRPLLPNLDPERIETFAYSNLPETEEDAFTALYKKTFNRWRNISTLGRDTIIQMIEADGIDILVDLAGHTAGNRLDIFGYRPAPVQVTWLGYPNTTGLAAIDYRIVDAVTDPRGLAEDFNTETLWRLPECFLCYTPNRDMPACLEAPFQANDGVVTFGCFNKLNKVTEETLHSWGRILARVENSRLVLKAKGLSGETARSWVTGIMATHGIGLDRLDLRGQTANYFEHAKMFLDIDIALDPHPYSGTTSTCEALWASVPVVTRMGERHASRVSGSILRTLGLNDLVGNGRDQYEDKAVALAMDPDRLRTLHRDLRETMKTSPLLDGVRYARATEQAYRGMWRAWCEKQA